MATVRDLVRLAMRAAQAKKAQDVKAFDLRGLSSVTDYMVVGTGSSDTNVRAIAEHVREKLAEKAERPFSVEGLQDGTWVLLDYVDFVVHVFHAEKRLYFGIEELWADAKQLALPAQPAKTGARKPADQVPVPAAPTAKKEALPPAGRAALKPAPRKSARAGRPAAGKRAPAPAKTPVPKRKTRQRPPR